MLLNLPNPFAYKQSSLTGSEIKCLRLRLLLGRRWYDAAAPLTVALCVLTFATSATARGSAQNEPTQSSLAVIQGGVQQAEDDAFVADSYRFLPGDYVYVTFSIAGFATKRIVADGPPRISLAYSVVPEDGAGVPLAAPDAGKIETELSPEDKNWVPKHRSSFLLPPFLASGTFQIRVAVRDELTRADVVKTFPLRVGGVRLQPADHVTAENFRFQRSENDTSSLELAAYRAGDTAYAQFEITGFKFGPENRYQLRYGVTVFRPDGKVYLDQPNAAELSSPGFYPAQFVPGRIAITTSPDSGHGQYKLLLKVYDQVEKQDFQETFTFQLE